MGLRSGNQDLTGAIDIKKAPGYVVPGQYLVLLT
jgi:hypothetical protein